MGYDDYVEKYSGTCMGRKLFLKFLAENPGSTITLMGETAPDNIMTVIEKSHHCQTVWFIKTTGRGKKLLLNMTSLTLDQALRFLNRGRSSPKDSEPDPVDT